MTAILNVLLDFLGSLSLVVLLVAIGACFKLGALLVEQSFASGIRKRPSPKTYAWCCSECGTMDPTHKDGCSGREVYQKS